VKPEYNKQIKFANKYLQKVRRIKDSDNKGQNVLKIIQ